MPSLRQFVERATEPYYGCVLKTSPFPAIGPQAPVVWKYLKRGEHIGMLPEIQDDEKLTPTVLKSLIADLNLPPMDFWLTF